MEATLNEKAENIKKTINGTAEKSKEAIREFIEANNKHVDAAVVANGKLLNTIAESLNHQAIDETVTTNLKNTFGKSVQLAEDALDSIINAYTRQMELTVDFNTKLVDAIKESKSENPEKVLDLIHENFEASRKMTLENTKDLLDFYNKHTNLALNFNKRFADNVQAQIETMFTIQNKGLNRFTSWAADWWKEADKK